MQHRPSPGKEMDSIYGLESFQCNWSGACHLRLLPGSWHAPCPPRQRSSLLLRLSGYFSNLLQPLSRVRGAGRAHQYGFLGPSGRAEWPPFLFSKKGRIRGRFLSGKSSCFDRTGIHAFPVSFLAGRRLALMLPAIEDRSRDFFFMKYTGSNSCWAGDSPT